ncbi:MAG: tetratricopeptide repeat protein, partial [Cellvibrionaceae bacterium]|nr:tetratricopeptide repeat protein [Cellvibrionaceae bacterium]
FAFGLLAYQVLGAPHPLGDSSSQLLMLERTLKAEPSELSASWAEAPAALNQLLLQLLQKDPAQRPANATAVAAQLRQLLPQMGTELSGEITQFEHSLALPQLKSARPWPKILAATGLAGAALAVLLWLWPLLNPFASPGLRVAVLPTQMESQSADDYELLRATVQQALQHGVDRQQKLHLVSPAELAAAGSADNIGTIVAADVVVTSQLNCHQDRCQLQLSRLMGSRWSVNGQVRTTLLHSSLFGAYNAVLVHTGKLFAERNSNVDQVNTISAEDYQRFAELRLRHQPGAKAAELIEPLEAILLKAPRFEPLYQFYTELVLASSAEPSPPLVDGLRRALDTAESLLPQSIPLQRHWFDLHLRLGELEAQQQRLQKLIDLGLPTAAVLSLRAQIALRNGDYQAAVGLYRQLLRQHKSVANYRALAHSLWTIGSGDEAKQLLQQALVLAPEHSQLLNMLGAVHLTLGELDQAVEQFQKHRRLQRDSRVESNLGLAYLLQRKYFKAQQAFAAALVLEPSNSALRLNLADSYLLLGQTEKAEQYYNNFLTQSNEQDWQAWLQRSQAYIHTGATIEALKAAEQAQVLAPGNNQVAFSSALTYSLAGNYPATLLWVEKSLDLGIAPVWFRLPWFDQLCSDTKFGPEFGKLVARSCGPLSGA